jgi:hypothetical protein
VPENVRCRQWLAEPQLPRVKCLRARSWFPPPTPETRSDHATALLMASSLAVLFDGERTVAVPTGRVATVCVSHEGNDHQIRLSRRHAIHLASSEAMWRTFGSFPRRVPPGPPRHYSRPPDRCRVLSWKISVWGGACAIRRTRRRRALDGDLCAARECPARGGRPCQFPRSRCIGSCVAAGTACWQVRAC